MSRTILLLPTELFSAILQYLSPSELRCAATVSRRFFSEANADLLWCMLCANAGLSSFTPVGGCSWKSFAHRCGLVSSPKASVTGSWRPLVGFPTSSALMAERLHNDSLPWSAASEKVEGHSLSSNVASVGIVDLLSRGDTPSLETSGFHVAGHGGGSRHGTILDQIIETTGLMLPHHGVSQEADDPNASSEVKPFVSLSYFDIAPQLDDATRVLYMKLDAAPVLSLLSEPHPDSEAVRFAAKQSAALLEVLWSTCATIVMAYDDVSRLLRWCDAVSQWLPDTSIGSITFSTHPNNPYVLLARSPRGNAGVASPSQEGSAPPTPRAAPTPPLGELSERDIHVLSTLPEPFLRWIALKCDGIRCVSADAAVDELLPVPKRYSIPSWVTPLASPPLLPCHILEMATAAALHTSPVSGMWTAEQMRRVAAPIIRQCVQFYTEAMKFEIDDHSQNGVVPLESVDFVAFHRTFFFAALRRFSIQIMPLCGSNVSAGLSLLETVKRDINTSFRELWRDNQNVSRAYCRKVFDRVFQPVAEEYLEGSGFNVKKAVQRWLSCMNAKIAMYCKAAPGPRSREVLAESFEKSFLPRFATFAANNPQHPYVIAYEMKSAIDELNGTAVTLLRNFWTAQDQVMSQMQRETAVYTAATGNEWAANVYSNTAQLMMQLRPLAEEWTDALSARCQALDIDPFPRDGNASLASLSAQLARLRLDAVQLSLANEGEQRAANTKALEASTASHDFLQEVTVVQHRKADRFESLVASFRRRLSAKAPK